MLNSRVGDMVAVTGDVPGLPLSRMASLRAWSAAGSSWMTKSWPGPRRLEGTARTAASRQKAGVPSGAAGAVGGLGGKGRRRSTARPPSTVVSTG
ncbi:MAG: hypothetical protein IPJ98_28440 [Bryobacterales bacterium]|nr:hypothetical protein [Bryobacterales bacterium]